MTNKEAINLLDNLIGMVEDNHDSDYDGALKVAINALEKQVPKKPEVEIDYTYISSGRCPCCKEWVNSVARYCVHCGQSLSWEDE